MRRFPLDKNYLKALGAQGMDPEEVLRRADLAPALAQRDDVTLSNEEYLRLMNAIAWAAPTPETLVSLATADGAESLSPALFSAYCSRDGLACLSRLAQFKSLAGPVRLEVTERGDRVDVAVLPWDSAHDLPEAVTGIEFCLTVNLIRKATRENVVPLEVRTRAPFGNPAFERYLGCQPAQGEKSMLTFSTSDLRIPFVSRNDSLQAFFQPELVRRLAELEHDDSVSAQVRQALIDLLPSGRCSAADVAHELAMSGRTLQRRLAAEGTTFMAQLNHTRELLARNYLETTGLSSMEIALLLGYQDVNSFYRAFSLWAGMTVSEFRARR